VTPSERGLDRELAWLRRSIGERYDTAAAFVSRVLSESPGLHSGSRASANDALTELAAVRLYLSGASTAIDAAIRAGSTGPHVPLARCAAAGLRRLPSYRGVAVLRTWLDDAQLAWYHEGRVVTERSFLAALSAVRPGLPGDTDILVWSLTARRTALVIPEVPDRVLFGPGTRFKVLRAHAGDRSVVLLRELSATESDLDDGTGAKRLPLDEIALTGLEQAHAFWQQVESASDGQPAHHLPDGHADGFSASPGLLSSTTPGGGPRRQAGQAATTPKKETPS
jgi:hypothetical protein